MSRASVLVWTFLLAGCGLESAVVGGTCKSGYVESEGKCVSSPNGVTSFAPPADSTAGPSGPSAPGTSDPSPVDPKSVDPKTVDPKTNPPPLIDPSVVNPPLVDPALLPPNPALVCEAPLVLCRGECISVENDPLNCGACGRMCPSNICVARECQGATPGDVVVIGHDMTAALSGSSHAKLLVNAVSIPTTDPIRVLSYEAADGVAHVRSLIGAGVKREVKFTTASASSVANGSLYADYDVVLVHGAKGIDAAGVGGSWATALKTFTKKGGVFVALDNGTSDVPSLVDATTLMTVGTRHMLASGTRFIVSGPSDVVGQQVLSPFAAFGASVSYDGPPPDGDTTWVVRTEAAPSRPTVIHRVMW